MSAPSSVRSRTRYGLNMAVPPLVCRHFSSLLSSRVASEKMCRDRPEWRARPASPEDGYQDERFSHESEL
jgi:hypothetical protein